MRNTCKQYNLLKLSSLSAMGSLNIPGLHRLYCTLIPDHHVHDVYYPVLSVLEHLAVGICA